MPSEPGFCTWKDLRIHHIGYKNGTHFLRFRIGDSFFEHFKYIPARSIDLTVSLIMIKQDSLIEIDFYISGTMTHSCDLCLSDYADKVDIRQPFIYRIRKGTVNEDQVRFISPQADRIDFSQEVFDWICLNVPMKKVPPEINEVCTACHLNIPALLAIKLAIYALR